jgi:hypothetical protein
MIRGIAGITVAVLLLGASAQGTTVTATFDTGSPCEIVTIGTAGCVYPRYPAATAQTLGYSSQLWDTYKASIGAGRPVELYVDLDASAMPDNFVAAFGYDAAAGTYAFYDSDYQNAVTLASFDQVSFGRDYGVCWGGTFFQVPDPATLGLLAGGLVMFGFAWNSRRRRGDGRRVGRRGLGDEWPAR